MRKNDFLPRLAAGAVIIFTLLSTLFLTSCNDDSQTVVRIKKEEIKPVLSTEKIKDDIYTFSPKNIAVGESKTKEWKHGEMDGMNGIEYTFPISVRMPDSLRQVITITAGNTWYQESADVDQEKKIAQAEVKIITNIYNNILDGKLDGNDFDVTVKNGNIVKMFLKEKITGAKLTEAVEIYSKDYN